MRLYTGTGPDAERMTDGRVLHESRSTSDDLLDLALAYKRKTGGCLWKFCDD